MTDAADAFRDELLRYGREAHAVGDAARAAPNDPVVNAYAAAAELFALSADSPARAEPFLCQAEASADAAARPLAAAVRAWADGDLARAARLFGERLRIAPADLAAARLCQIVQIDLGDFAGMCDGLAALLPTHPGNHYLLGQYAFALEEAGRSDAAAPVAERAVTLATRAGADDPWSWHALAHIHHRRGDLHAVIALVANQEPLWARSSGFMATHAWWHAALCRLTLGEPEAALAIYDERLAGQCARCAQSLAARVSMLAQLRIAGLDVDARLAAEGDALAERARDHRNGFLDLHYLYGLALLGRPEAAALRAGLADPVAQQGGDGLLAHAAGEMAAAAALLAAVAPALPTLGGSHEQRGLYAAVRDDAARRAGVRARGERRAAALAR